MISELIASMNHPEEIRAMLKLKFNGQFQYSSIPKNGEIALLTNRDFSYKVLNRVSRSFAAVIQELPTEVQDAVCAFYLVLRGLDSVEDDMNLPIQKRLKMLESFYEDMMNNEIDYTGIGDTADYRLLMAHFSKVTGFLKQQRPEYAAVVVDITQRMAEGMVEFSEREVKSQEDFDLYCHYVAGLVGHGLTDLFAVSGLENPKLFESKVLANSMGLFLQKTNIIRDYYEDLVVGRTFWPSAIWKKGAESLDHFSKHPEEKASLAVLNELVTDAMRHLPDCIAYLRLLNNPAIFRFCAIPQAMALATLNEVYDNPLVFTSSVKIRKGLASKIMVDLKNMDDMQEMITALTEELLKKIKLEDPNCALMADYLHKTIMKLQRSSVFELPSDHLGEYRKVS
jgi:farnesyl-diphosphate farnesyltransferase